MERIKILLITHDFEPMQSPEAIRSIKYVKYLNRCGFDVYVLNSKRKKGNIIRRIMARYDIIPDSCGKWIKPAFKEACEIIEREKIDIILSRSMPIVSHKVVLKIKEKYPEIPWIAEFSDPWTQSPYKKYKFKFGKEKDELDEESIFSKCNKIIATSNRTAKLFEEKYPGTVKKIKVVLNFYDEEDFNNKNANLMIREKFLIMHTGNFYGIRTPEYLFKALKKIEEENKDNNIMIILIGNLGKYNKLVKKYNISQKLLQIRPSVDRKDAIELLKYADAYLLIDAPSEKPSVFLPSKLPEYLYMRKPIIALTPEGTVKDIIKETKTGICINPEDIDKIKIGLEYVPLLSINKFINIEKYDIKNCIWDLTLIIKEVIDDVKNNQRLRSQAEFSKNSSINENI
jgi:glycosyltransferase involved in cell wall biosynthesis